ncbi:MAG: alanyl-tRNA editing protein [Oscillospiraceae bacterium]|nr:alanyl-tRNA editing protein [Oscillospiraceae bacterium]
MQTEKLFYADPFLRTFRARVLSCETAGDAFTVTLDRTAFYPEGGGQNADHGTLGGVSVTDVHEKGGVVLHTCTAPLTVGSDVDGEIDFVRRFDHMQQHSGEHIVSGMICAAFSCDNVGFHMGADVVTIDFNAEITFDALREIERRANEYIYENHPISIQTYRGAELDAVDYRSKKALEGDVRIVTFEGADCCACCGTHVLSSGQVGIVKFLSCQPFRGGSRIELLCGARAYRYLSATWEQNLHVAQSLSAKPTESFAAVSRVQNELAEAKHRAAALEERIFAATAKEYDGRGDILLFEDGLSTDGVRRLCDAVGCVCGGRCAVFSGEDGAYKYAVALPGGDLRAFTKELNEALHGRGGGKPHFVQGSAACTRAEAEAFFAD